MYFHDFFLFFKATVAAFAASEGHAHPRVVELPKTEEGLGFNVMGGKEQNSPIYISRIIPGGVADRVGGLKRGDQLLSVNGVSVEGEHHEKAVELLKAAIGSVKLVVRYTPKGKANFSVKSKYCVFAILQWILFDEFHVKIDNFVFAIFFSIFNWWIFPLIWNVISRNRV